MLCGFLIGREGQVQGNFPLVASYEFLDIPESLASNFRICSFLLKSWDERSSLELLPSEACWDRDAVFIYGFLAAYHITRNRQLLFQVWLPVKWSLKSFSTYKEEATVSPSIKWGDIRCKIDKLCVCVRMVLEYLVGNKSIIFPTQESNWGLLNCGQILYQLSYQWSYCTKYIIQKIYFQIKK